MSKKKKPYFPNNWKAYYDCPSSMFDELSFDVLYVGIDLINQFSH